jgi:hypothetical protein
MEFTKYTRSVPGCSLTRLYGTATGIGIYRLHTVLSYREDPFGGITTVETVEIGTIDETKEERHFVPSLEYAVSMVLLDWQYQGVQYIKQEAGSVNLSRHVLLEKSPLVHPILNRQNPDLRDTVRRLLRAGVRLPLLPVHDMVAKGGAR